MSGSDKCFEKAIRVTEGRGVALSRVVREGLFEEVPYEQNPELWKGASQGTLWKRNVLSWEKQVQRPCCRKELGI